MENSILLRETFKFACFVGMLYQMVYITIEYKRYRTVSRVDREVPDAMPPPNIAVCLRYVDILNYSLVVEKKDVSPDDLLTVSEILAYTPNSSDILTRCSFRKPNKDKYYHEEGKGCQQIFKITKFYLQEFLCYRIEQLDRELLSFEQIATSIFHQGAIYDIVLNRSILTSQRMKMMLFYGSFPYFSHKLAPIFDVHYINGSSQMDRNLFTASFRFFDVLLLPPPYETRCNSSGDEGPPHCYFRCMVSRLQPINRIPFNHIIAESMPAIHFSVADSRMPDVLSFFENTDRECRMPCSYDYCYANYTVTRVELERGNSSELRIRTSITTQPTAKIVTDPKISFSAYLIYATSCFGTWLGLSVLHFNPFEERVGKSLQRFKAFIFPGPRNFTTGWSQVQSKGIRVQKVAFGKSTANSFF